MSRLENKILEENAFETFICESQDNYDFDSMLQCNYFEHSEVWMAKEYGEAPEEAYDRTFEELLAKDYEGMLKDPIETAYYYAKDYQPKQMRG